jgi:Holliday junction resolvase
MSGRRSRSEGARTERCIVNALQAYGLAAVRVPLSCAVGCVEIKARADGFRELIVKADRQEPLVVARLSLAVEIAKVAV